MSQSAAQLVTEIRAQERRVDDMLAQDPATMAPDAVETLRLAMAELEKLQVLLEARTARDEGERRAGVMPIGGGDPRFSALTRQITISDAIQASLGVESRGASLAREASQEIARQRGKNPAGVYISLGSAAAVERRAVVTTGAQGTPNVSGPLVPTIVRGDLLIDALRANLVLEQLGATFLTGLTGNISIPRVATGTQVGWFAENASIPDASIGFDAVGLTVKHVGAIMEYTRTTLLNSTPDIDALLRNDLMRALAVEIEHAALVGSGDGVVPRGIVNTVGVQTVAMGNSLTWTGVLAMIGKLGTANIPQANRGWVGSSAVKAKAMGVQSVPGVASPFIMSGDGMLAGFPFQETNQIPATAAVTGPPAVPPLSTLIYGAWSNLLVGIWDSLDLTTNPWGDVAYRRGGVQVRIIADLDVAVRYPTAFVVATDVAA